MPGHNIKNCPAKRGNNEEIVGHVDKRACILTEKMKSYKVAEAAGPDSDNDAASSVGSIGDADSVVEPELEEDLKKLVWKPCTITVAPLDEKGAEQLPQIAFTATDVGVVADKLAGLTPMNTPDHLMLFWTRDLCLEMIASSNAYGFMFVKGWKEMDGIEFLSFLGVVIYLGCCSYPSRKAV